MNRKVYTLPHSQRLERLSRTDKELARHTVQIVTIDDTDRARYLLEGGYLPYWLKDFHAQYADALVDWAFAQKMGPAYWRTPTPEDLANRNPMHPTANLAFGGNCDRDRIDHALLEKARSKP